MVHCRTTSIPQRKTPVEIFGVIVLHAGFSVNMFYYYWALRQSPCIDWLAFPLFLILLFQTERRMNHQIIIDHSPISLCVSVLFFIGVHLIKHCQRKENLCIAVCLGKEEFSSVNHLFSLDVPCAGQSWAASVCRAFPRDQTDGFK